MYKTYNLDYSSLSLSTLRTNYFLWCIFVATAARKNHDSVHKVKQNVYLTMKTDTKIYFHLDTKIYKLLLL